MSVLPGRRWTQPKPGRLARRDASNLKLPPRGGVGKRCLSDFGVRRRGDLLNNPVNGFQPPLSAAARAVPTTVQSRRDAAKAVALPAEFFNLRQHGLLG